MVDSACQKSKSATLLPTDLSKLVASYLADLATSHAQQVRRGMSLHASEGRHSGAIPIGYLLNVHSRGGAVQDPLKAAIVSKPFALVLSGLSLRQLLPKVRALGLVGRDGRPASMSTLARILSNPFYAGSIRYNGKLYPGLHEAIVSAQDCQKVQHLLSEFAANKK